MDRLEGVLALAQVLGGGAMEKCPKTPGKNLEGMVMGMASLLRSGLSELRVPP